MSAKVLPFPRREDPRALDPGAVDGPDPASGREPPHDLTAEKAMLSAMLLDGNDHEDGTPCAAARALEIVAPDHCYSTAHVRICEAIRELRVSKTPIDAVTVRAWLKAKEWLGSIGGVEYLAALADETPSIGNVVAHAEVVRDAYEDRLLIAAVSRVRVEGYLQRTAADRAAWRAEVRRELGRLTAPRARLVGAPIGVAAREVRERIEAQNAGHVLGVGWGPSRLAPHLTVPSLEVLEEQIGIFVRKQQYVIAGLSEHGKTSLAGHVAIAIASLDVDAFGVGEAVYVLSGEMDRAAFVHRLACSLANVDAALAQAGRLHPDASERFSRWLAFVATLPIIVDHEPVEAAELARRVREHKRLFETGQARRADGELYPKCRLQLVIGDHVQKLAAVASGCGRGADMKERLRAVSHGWQNHIAKGVDVATVLLAQVGRKFLDDPKRRKGFPRKSDVEGASEIEQDADAIQIVHRPELLADDERDVADEWRGVAAVIAAKRRFGGEGARVVRMKFRRGIFQEMPPV